MDERLDITICIGSSCHLKGSRDIVRSFERLVAAKGLEGKVTLKGSFCQGLCAEHGVCVAVGEEKYSIIPAEAEKFFNETILPAVK